MRSAIFHNKQLLSKNGVPVQGDKELRRRCACSEATSNQARMLGVSASDSEAQARSNGIGIGRGGGENREREAGDYFAFGAMMLGSI